MAPAEERRNRQVKTEEGLTAKQLQVLMSLLDIDPTTVPVRELQAEIEVWQLSRVWVGVDPDGLIQTLKALLLRGFVYRVSVPRRRRCDAWWEWGLTDSGREVLDRYIDRVYPDELVAAAGM